jgi:hypothetical protein
MSKDQLLLREPHGAFLMSLYSDFFQQFTEGKQEVLAIRNFLLRQGRISTLVRIHLALRQDRAAQTVNMQLSEVYKGRSDSQSGRELTLHKHIMSAVSKYPVFLFYEVSLFFCHLAGKTKRPGASLGSVCRVS